MDRISGLPKVILHDILSRLSEKEAVRTRLLSRAWAETGSTFPVLSIVDQRFLIFVQTLPQPQPVKMSTMFLDYVEKQFRSFTSNLTVKEVKLDISRDLFDLQDASLGIHRCISLASSMGAEVLKILLPINYEGFGISYTLQPCVFESKSLKKLVVKGGVRVDQAFLNCSTKSFLLQELYFQKVILGDEKDFMNLILHRCPMIEDIALRDCYVFIPPRTGGLLLSRPRVSLLQSVSLHGLQKLKRVDICGIHNVLVDAPNLEYLRYDMDQRSTLNCDNCKNLRSLFFSSLPNIVHTEWLLDLFSKFPLLESFKLVTCSVSESIVIRSAELKVLEFLNCSNLKEVVIDARSLLLCTYSAWVADIPRISFLTSSNQLEFNVNITMMSRQLSFLKETIQKFKTGNVLASLSLTITTPYLGIAKQDLDISPSRNIKNLEILAVPPIEASELPFFVNYLLSSCSPETISLNVGFCNKEFIKVLSETLYESRWNVKATSSLRPGDESVDLRTMLDALPKSGILKFEWLL